MILSLVAAGLLASSLPALAGAATPGPAWEIDASINSPTNFAPGDTSGRNTIVVQATNIGSKATSGPITITDVLPPGITPHPRPFVVIELPGVFDDGAREYPCDFGPPISCTISTVTIRPGQRLTLVVPVDVAPDAPSVVTNQVSVSGGGAPGASASAPITIDSEPAPFGFKAFKSMLLDVDGSAVTQAGSHPFQMRVNGQLNTVLAGFESPPAENPLDIEANLPEGLVLNPQATPVRCTEAEFEAFKPFSFSSTCPDAAAVGVARVTVGIGGVASPDIVSAIYNLVPPPGSPAAFGFNVGGFGINVHLLGRVREGDYGISSFTGSVPQYASFSGVSVDLWGDPDDPSHDFRRGECAAAVAVETPAYPNGCPVPDTKSPPLITMPSACSGPLVTTVRANSWQNRDTYVSASAQTEDPSGNPAGVSGCDKLSYAPENETKMSTDQAESGSGMEFTVDFPNNGLEEKGALSESVTSKAIVTLPKGVTINPSVGEGLGFCTPGQYDRETVDSIDGEGCPNDSRVGTLHLETPLVDEALNGSVYLAQQDDPGTSTPGAENPFDSLIALYMVLKNPILGVVVKQALKVEPDPVTGQLVATLEDIPQLPFSHFNFRFKEGARAALITPPACGKYTTVAKLYPSSDPTDPRTVNSSFEITKGVDGGPCPSGGLAPFRPEFQAGAENNSAGAFSPFNMRIIRHDGDQDMTKFSSILPPGELGSLAGVDKCPDAAVEIAKSKTGRQELASPSCPANSQIGRTLAGAGVGDSLTYAGGQLYLAGPYKGAPLSVISITPAVAGPFDAGTVVVRLALQLNSKTAEVEVDGANSDPIPHILKGIVLKVRDLRVYVDRPDFTLNPTSCEVLRAKATLFGSYLDVFNPADDVPADLSTRYQAADCASLGYKPRLKLDLKGGTKRGGHPRLKALYTPRRGDANTKGVVVRLPRSAFLDQAHIRTICTRVQFAADACPKGARYGYVKAWTPLLEEPLQGPVWLRSSNHKLPDMVFDLRGLVDVEVATRIDSARGGIRASIEDAPDAPITKVELRMQGGKKGLIVNSRNLCGALSRANVELTGHNGKLSTSNPVMRAQCAGKRKGKRGRG